MQLGHLKSKIRFLDQEFWKISVDFNSIKQGESDKYRMLKVGDLVR